MGRAFIGDKKNSGSVWSRQLLPLALFICVAALFVWGVSGLETASGDERVAMMERAVTKAVIHCYAMEGQYPSSVAYLRENYGLAIDEEKYVVHLDFIGGNIMPQIIILEIHSLTG